MVKFTSYKSCTMIIGQTIKHLAFLIIILTSVYCASAQDFGNLGHFSEARMRNLSQFQGLSSSKITSIVKDTKDFIWIGTDNGLNRYDGTRITLFQHDPKNDKTIVNNRIQTLYVDRNGILWIGTKNGLFTFDDEKQSFIKQIIDPEKIDFVNSLCEDQEGNLWIANNCGLIKLALF
jgi:ligand-binding sensor domain-containing protein